MTLPLKAVDARAATARRYLADGLHELACDECGAGVLVRKNSQQQTSVQWSVAAVGACAQFALHRALGEASARVRTCTSLRDTIEHALVDGRLAVVPPDGSLVEPAPRGRPPHGGGDDEQALEREALELAVSPAGREGES